MYKRRILCALAVCMAVSCTACAHDKADTYVLEGDVVSESDDGVDEETAGGTNMRSRLGIPDKVELSLDTEGTPFNQITIKDDETEVPDTDRMYTKTYVMGEFTADEKEKIVKLSFDYEDGVCVYPYDEDADVGYEQIEEILGSTGGDVDFSANAFAGKIDGICYVLYFNTEESVYDTGYRIVCADKEDIPEDVANAGAVDYEYDLITYQSSGNSYSEEEEKAISIARDFLAKCGYDDGYVNGVNTLTKNYVSSYGELVSSESAGYSVDMWPAIENQGIYSPEAFGIDTISHSSTSDGSDFSGSNFYYVKHQTYTVNCSDGRLVGFYAKWPLIPDGDIAGVDTLITWDEAVAALETVLPQHFADYTGYSDVEFDDVRLTYFVTEEGERTAAVIPVYVFAETDGDEDWPIQLVMLDARDGSEVSIVQDDSRMGKH